jgi:ABC-type uncharacterized transport system YnjBCD ATPase subunit
MCPKNLKQAKIQLPKNVRGEQGRASRLSGALLQISCGDAKVQFPATLSEAGQVNQSLLAATAA